MASIRKGMSNEDYRAVNAWSKSDLDLLHKSPALVEWNRDHKGVGSESVDLGTHIHTMMLEPERFKSEYLTMPNYNMRTKEGRDQADEFLAMAGNDKAVLDKATTETLESMRNSILAHPVARSLLTGEGDTEQSIFWSLDGLRLKARPDKIMNADEYGHILVDLKKTADINKFKFSAKKFRYHVQAAFYSDAYEQLTGIRPRFVFVVVGEMREIGRHPVRVFEFDSASVEQGRSEYLSDLELAREYEDFGAGLHTEEITIF